MAEQTSEHAYRAQQITETGLNLEEKRIAPGDPMQSFRRTPAVHRAAGQDDAQGIAIFLTGLSGAGKTTLAREMSSRLEGLGTRVTLLDGDELRARVSPELGFSRTDRESNLLRAALIASEVVKHGGIVVCSFIAPYERSREGVREIIEQHGRFVLVYVSTPLEECERRDPKGLYKKARLGLISNFTGVSDIYEIPKQCDLVVDTTSMSPFESADLVMRRIGVAQSKASDLQISSHAGGLAEAEAHHALLFQRILHATSGRRTSLGEVAREAGVNRRQVEKTIRKMTGKSFREFQMSLLFERASISLNRGCSIKESAFELGFGSPQAFHRFIRKMSGKTPTELRSAQ